MLLEVFVAAFAIMLASLAGVVVVWKRFGVFVERNLPYLVTFASGVFAIVVYHLVEEVLELGASALLLIGGMLTGALVLEGGSRLIPGAHHHHSSDHPHTHSRLDARRLLFGDAVHNIGDGILLVPAFLISPYVGMATALGIFLHEVVQEISEFFVLKEGGYSNKQALARNFIVSSTILLGVFAGMVLVSAQQLVVPLLAFSAGGFFYVIVRDLLPSTIRSVRYKKSNFFLHFLVFVIGLWVMWGIISITPHGPEDEHGHEDETHLLE